MSTLYDDYATLTRATGIAHAEDVRRTAAHFASHLLPLLAKLEPGLEQGAWLEFGAGWGRNLLALRELGIRDVIGVDISREQVALAHRVGLPEMILIDTRQDLSQALDGRRFDFLLAIDVLEHLSLHQLEAFAAAARTVLRPGGLLVVQVPNDLAPFNPVRSGDLTHLRAFTPASIRQFFLLAGAQPISVFGIPFPGTGWSQAGRRALVALVVAPLVRLVSVALYGRGADEVHVTPNLLGVARLLPQT
jgi:2-polyprenyl-3-methyl-5-hydroxy-6-metoxy-1,4-benzoquinol methylase